MMLRRSGLLGALALALLAGCTVPANGDSNMASGCVAGEDKGQSAAGMKQVTLCVRSATKTHKFTAEVAATTMEQAKGMMFRTEMPDNTAMIFPFAQPKPASFWMKNTVIPLDIIFVRPNGTIESIAENTVPYSTQSVFSGEPVGAVLEIRGGLATELGIQAGDMVQWRGK